MRLREIAEIVNDAITVIDDISIVTNSSSGVIQILDLTTLRSILNEIEETGILTEIVEALKSNPVYTNTADKMTITADDRNFLSRNISLLKSGLQNIAKSINDKIPPANQEDFISIKLPEVHDFDDLAKAFDLLKKAISIPISSNEIGGKVNIKNFDNGSLWVDITVGSTIAVSLIGSIAWAGAVIYKKINEARISEQFISTLNINNEHLENIKRAASAQIDTLIDLEAAAIANQYYSSDDVENLKRLSLSIGSMSKLISKGAEIHPSLLAPEKAANLFPPYNNLGIVESMVKQIDKE